jgi:protein-S-isoprenylcysteine O-methyltransferase Ste14
MPWRARAERVRLGHHDRVSTSGQEGDGDSSGRPDGGFSVVFSDGEMRTAQLLVTAQFVLLGLIALLPGGWGWPVPVWLRWLGVAGAVAGVAIMLLGGTALGRGLTAVPIPNRHAVLRTGGLYRVVRHPIYTGLLLTAGSFTAASGNGWRALAFLALVALLTVKARWEEARLARRFAAYPAYAARTPRFVPGWRPRP